MLSLRCCAPKRATSNDYFAVVTAKPANHHAFLFRDGERCSLTSYARTSSLTGNVEIENHPVIKVYGTLYIPIEGIAV